MSRVVLFPGERYTDVKNGRVNMLFTVYDNRLPVHVNDCIPCVFHGLKDSMLLEITGSGYTDFGKLSDDDAYACGFNNVGELKKDLLGKYPTLDNVSRLYYYIFTVIGVSEKVGE